MNYQAFASEMSFLVLERQRAERDGRDVPKVKAPTEKPSRFDAYPTVTNVGVKALHQSIKTAGSR